MNIRAYAAVLATTVVAAVSHAQLPHFSHTGKQLDSLDPGVGVTVSFPFTNTGTDTIVVYDIISGCGCDAYAGAPGRQYRQGDTGAVTVTISATGPGARFSCAVTAMFRTLRDSTGARASAATLTITAPLRNSIQFDPPVLTALHVNHARAPLLGGWVVNTGPRPVTVLSLALDTPSVLDVLTRQLPCELEPQERLPFVVSTVAGAEIVSLNAIQSRLHLRTSSAPRDRYTCGVYLYLE